MIVLAICATVMVLALAGLDLLADRRYDAAIKRAEQAEAATRAEHAGRRTAEQALAKEQAANVALRDELARTQKALDDADGRLAAMERQAEQSTSPADAAKRLGEVAS